MTTLFHWGAGIVPALTATRGTGLGAPVWTELGTGMVLLSRLLNRSVNRWGNTIAAPMTTFFVIGGGSAYPHELLLAATEVVCLLLIIRHARSWERPEVASRTAKTAPA